MTAFKGLGTYGNAVGVVTPLDHKLSNAAQVVKTTTALQIRAGLFFNGNATIVTGTAGMAYSVAAFQCVTQRSAAAGAVFGGNDGALSVATTAAPGSNSRIDIIYIWHREFSLDGVDSNPVIGVVQGTAAAVPVAPSLAAFPGAIELGRASVAAGAVATNGAGVTITQTAPFTALHGGVVAFRNTTERDLWTTALTDQRVVDLSTGLTYRWNGSAWKFDGNGLVPIIPTGVAGAGVTLGAGGTVTAAASTSISILGIGSADFDTIRLEWAGAGTAGANVSLRVRTGGADIVAANYNHVAVESSLSAGPTRSATTGNTSGDAGRMDNGQGAGWLQITNLFQATATTWQGTSVDASTARRDVAGRHTLPTSYPDLTIIIGAGNFTGKIRVYGYNNN